MHVDPKDWPALSRLMDDWLDLPEERRDPWLAGLGPEYAELLPALRQLLSEPKPGFLEALPEVDPPPADAAPFGEGALVGPYRLLRELGRGGMGVVWLAGRADGTLNRQVALKLPLLYLHGPALAERFARERDILARLTDARIARLYDAGITADGQPYLALEYVEGEPITDYCDRLRLDIPSRLRLFLEVLRAVQYAHANLVVHRDLKPSNILVTKSGEVRLLDFGIAKLLAEGEAGETEITRFAGRALTPDFASPEQIVGGAITTAADVYSLGILLYELLTGSRPYSLKGSTSGVEMARQIETIEPARPSQVPGGEPQAHARASTMKRLQAALRGDLDTIVLKAIQKQPPDRYTTADAFAQDIERHLSGQPVIARPESAWYRAKKFVWRNKLAVTSVAAVALALAGGAGVAIWQARRALHEKQRADLEAASARAVSDFLENDVLTQASSYSQAAPGRRPDPNLTVRTALDRAAANIGGKFDGKPAVEADIRQTIADAYLNLGLYPEAQPHMERAFDLRRRVLGPAHADTLGIMSDLAELYRREGKYAQAETLFSNLMDIERSIHQENDPAAFAARHALANLVSDWHADYSRGEAMYRSLIPDERRVLGESHRTTLASTNNLAELLSREGKFAEAEALYRTLIDTKRRALGPDHPSTLISVNNLGGVLRDEGKFADAESIVKSAVEARVRTVGPHHPDTLLGMNGLGLAYLAEGKYDDAERTLTSAADDARSALGADNPYTLAILDSVGELYRRQNRLKRAEETFQSIVDALRRTSGLGGALARNAEVSLAEVKVQLHEYAAAEALLRDGLEGFRKSNQDTWKKYYAQCLLGASLAGQGRHAEALPLLTTGYQRLLERRDTIQFDRRPVVDQAREWLDAESSRLKLLGLVRK